MEIKYQLPYTPPASMPSGPHRTIIRNNVFVKEKPQSSWPPDIVDGPRPNFLVGGFPSSGPGSSDWYEIYANFFYKNPDESLFQGSGRIAFHDNILVGASDTAALFIDHDLPLKIAHVYNNTIYGGNRGISVSGSSLQASSIRGNLVFSASGISGANQAGNLVDTTANAALYVKSPSLTLGGMDFYPLPGKGTGSALDMTAYTGQIDYNFDFNGQSKGTFIYRGAYAGSGTNPGWRLNNALKVGGPSSGVPLDNQAPNPPTDLKVTP